MIKFFEEENFDETFPHTKTVAGFEFINCTFSSIDFSQANFSLAKFIDCHFSKCNFSNADLKSGTFRSPRFSHCKLLGINWTNLQTLALPVFDECLMDYCVFQGMNLVSSVFKDSSLKEVDFYECKLGKSSFGGSTLTSSNFNKSDLGQADFRYALKYEIDVRYTNVKKAKFSLPEALGLLAALDIEIE